MSFFRGARKPSYRLCSTILKGLPPLTQREERRKQPSILTHATMESWEFSISLPASPTTTACSRWRTEGAKIQEDRADPESAADHLSMSTTVLVARDVLLVLGVGDVIIELAPVALHTAASRVPEVAAWEAVAARKPAGKVDTSETEKEKADVGAQPLMPTSTSARSFEAVLGHTVHAV
ncbi:hypothetical protein C8Q76DRAFT_792060 [Earliella scabrosa]|nr:hypothetical protein C8Q76DRAFT_792060 [Earliella scabrosa]